MGQPLKGRMGCGWEASLKRCLDTPLPYYRMGC